MMAHRFSRIGGVAIVIAIAVVAQTAWSDLFSYVAKPDSAFKWELRGVEELPNGKVYDLHMVSQVWQGIKWEHQVQVYEPRTVEFPDVMGLLITGGGANKEDRLLGLTIAGMAGARLATLYHIPNQPLFNGLTEDALISYTWVKYLQTGDEDWILLFPMVKSAVRAMDCLEQLAQQQWKTKLRGFVVTGASKRGWTTYLTGAAAPERVIGIAPMVFDILNIGVQVAHQKLFWGDYSEQIADYTTKGLQFVGEEGRGFRLLWMVDPYSYRQRLLMPKLVILGSNDRYWPVDAVTYYWRGLAHPKALLIAPNSGHGLEDHTRVLGSTCSFLRVIAKKAPMPRADWDLAESPEGLTISVVAKPKPVEARVWVARSDVRDFREAKWAEQPLKPDGDKLVGRIARAEGKYTAAYGEVVFDVDGRKFYLSTEPGVLHPK